MPDKPIWAGRLDEAVRELAESPDPWVDCSRIRRLLGVGRRRAQQILAPCVGRQIGASGVAERDAVIAHLQRLAGGQTAEYEQRRRRRLAEQLDALHRERREGVIVAAPMAVVNQAFQNLPDGVSITPGNITVTFSNPTVALQKLLALAMAIRNDELGFERLATGAK